MVPPWSVARAQLRHNVQNPRCRCVVAVLQICIGVQPLQGQGSFASRRHCGRYCATDAKHCIESCAEALFLGRRHHCRRETAFLSLHVSRIIVRVHYQVASCVDHLSLCASLSARDQTFSRTLAQLSPYLISNNWSSDCNAGSKDPPTKKLSACIVDRVLV